MTTPKNKSIPIERLTPDMTLASDITKPNGDMIFSKGEKLTETIIVRFKKFDIRKVDVLIEETGTGEEREQGEEKLEKALIDLNHRFRRVGHIPLMEELKGIIGEHLKGNLIS